MYPIIVRLSATGLRNSQVYVHNGAFSSFAAGSAKMIPGGIHKSLHWPLRSHLFLICRHDRRDGIVVRCMWEKLPVQRLPVPAICMTLPPDQMGNSMADKIEILDEFGEVLKAVKVREGQDGSEGVSWEGEFLFGAQLAGANFKGADLCLGGFFMAMLDGANFEGAQLRGADLKDTSCVGASFRNADLGRDSFGGGTCLQSANLTKAILNRANLDGAEYDDRTVFPKGFFPSSHGMIETETEKSDD